jgi:tartrate dehydrogenase/decarboxylase/D-malate dehydrogenase
MKYRIAVYPGDGIGLEVTPPAVQALQAASAHASPKRERGIQAEGLELEFTELDWGLRHYQQHGSVVPEDFLEVLRPFDAILLGAVGWPALLPDHVTLAPLVKIRQAFDQYACVRPAKLYPGVRCPLAGKGPQDIDFVVIRENSEGEYVDQGGRLKRGTPDEVAVQTALHTRRGIERILRYGFALARQLRKKLTMITKSNAQKYGYVLWDEILAELAPQFPDIAADKQHCDAAAMNFVRSPEQFDVVVASNLFGDLLTDLGGVISGGLGLAPSTNTNPERTFPSMFEPVHGSAPDIAGRGIANPIAAILSAAMLLDHLRQPQAAERIRTAVAATLASGVGTPDLGGKLKTEEMGREVVERIK